jgi:hypothetical protein
MLSEALRTPELHDNARSGTAGRGLNRDPGPRAGLGSYSSTHAHLGTAGRGTLWEQRAASGPTRKELCDSERTYVSTHAYLGTAGRGTRKGTVGCERAGGSA